MLVPPLLVGGPLVNFGAIIEEHVLRIFPDEIIRRHAKLHVDVGNSACGVHRPAPLGDGVVGRHQVLELAHVGVVPPALFRVEVVFVRFQAERYFRVFCQSALVGMLEFSNQFCRIVDPGQFAEHAGAPSAEHGKIVDVGARLVCSPHRQAIAFQCFERLAGMNIQIKGVGGDIGLVLIDQLSDRVIGVKSRRSIPQDRELAKLVIGQSAPNRRAAFTVNHSCQHQAVCAATR